ncbi:MAG: NAD-dependent epimerase/dehydratase family protein [Steroidobacteraceae bacterium]
MAARERRLDVVVTGQVNNDNERARVGELERAGIPLATGPLQDPAFAGGVVAGCDLVIHLAAAQHEANVPDAYFEEVNVGGTRALIEAAIASGVRRFVYGSTIGVYGSASQGTLDEESPPNPDNVYGRTKLSAERVVHGHSAQIETCIVRISETYGPADYRLLKLFRAIDKGAFIMIGDGQNRRQVIHVADLIRGLLVAAEHPAALGQTFVMPGSEVMTTREMVDTIAGALGRPRPRLRLPMWPFIAAALILEKTLGPLGIQPPLHRRRLDFFRKTFMFSTRKAELLLDFRPRVTFSQGARETAAWYRDRGLLGAG